MTLVIPMQVPPLIDFEASSLSDCSYPISVAILLRGEVHYWLIKPEPDWIDWSLESQAIHGMSRSFIESNGESAKAVYTEIMKIMDGTELIYTDNPQWDAMWFSRLGNARFQFRNIRELLSQQQIEMFYVVRKRVFDETKLTAHRADHDVIALGLILSDLTDATC